MGYEVEIKFRVTDPAALDARLSALGIEPGEPVRHADHYLAHPARDFAATDEALRIRRIGDENRITYKGPKKPGPTKTREEIEVPFDPGEAEFDKIARVFERLGFRPVAVVEKTRREADIERQGRPIAIALDDAGGLGRFAEVEALAADEGDLAAAQEAVVALGRELGLSEVEPRSYLRMTLERRGADPS